MHYISHKPLEYMYLNLHIENVNCIFHDTEQSYFTVIFIGLAFI